LGSPRRVIDAPIHVKTTMTSTQMVMPIQNTSNLPAPARGVGQHMGLAGHSRNAVPRAGAPSQVSMSGIGVVSTAGFLPAGDDERFPRAALYASRPLLPGDSPVTARAPASPRPARAAPPRAWQRMLSGRKLDLLDPSPLDIEVEDIAHGLARVARWNGQTRGEHPFSVAQHSLVVLDIVRVLSPRLPQSSLLCALLHDAPEYVIGDMISPFKNALGLDYRAFEHRLAAAIHLRFGLPPDLSATLKALIKRADLMSAYLEARQLAGFSDEESRRFFRTPPLEAMFDLVPLSAAQAQLQFLDAFQRLAAER
jgi:uncharacterized protein